MDGLGEIRRLGDGDAMNTAISGNADGAPSCRRSRGFQRPDPEGAGQRYPCDRLQCQRQGAWDEPALAYVGQDLFHRASRWAIGSSASSTRACGALYSHAWAAQHPAENRRREAGHRGLRGEHRDPADRTSRSCLRRGPGSKPGTTVTRMWQECSPSTLGAPRASPR